MNYINHQHTCRVCADYFTHRFRPLQLWIENPFFKIQHNLKSFNTPLFSHHIDEKSYKRIIHSRKRYIPEDFLLTTRLNYPIPSWNVYSYEPSSSIMRKKKNIKWIETNGIETGPKKNNYGSMFFPYRWITLWYDFYLRPYSLSSHVIPSKYSYDEQRMAWYTRLLQLSPSELTFSIDHILSLSQPRHFVFDLYQTENKNHNDIIYQRKSSQPRLKSLGNQSFIIHLPTLIEIPYHSFHHHWDTFSSFLTQGSSRLSSPFLLKYDIKQKQWRTTRPILEEDAVVFCLWMKHYYGNHYAYTPCYRFI